MDTQGGSNVDRSDSSVSSKSSPEAAQNPSAVAVVELVNDDVEIQSSAANSVHPALRHYDETKENSQFPFGEPSGVLWGDWNCTVLIFCHFQSFFFR